MTTVKTRTFLSGGEVVIPLPEEVAFGADVELVVVRSGDVMTIYPAWLSIQEMVDRLNALPKPPSIEVRDEEEIPERPGL